MCDLDASLSYRCISLSLSIYIYIYIYILCFSLSLSHMVCCLLVFVVVDVRTRTDTELRRKDTDRHLDFCFHGIHGGRFWNCRVVINTITVMIIITISSL